MIPKLGDILYINGTDPKEITYVSKYVVEYDFGKRCETHELTNENGKWIYYDYK